MTLYELLGNFDADTEVSFFDESEDGFHAKVGAILSIANFLERGIDSLNLSVSTAYTVTGFQYTTLNVKDPAVDAEKTEEE